MKRGYLKRGTSQMKRSGFKLKPRKPLAKKRKKRSPKEITKDKAWVVFSKFIRNRDKNCVTCPTGKAENAGHFWHAVLDFDEMNINGQCVRCNKWLSGNLAIYSTYLINKYGIEKFKDLEARHYKAIGGEYRSLEDYERIINHYTRKLG